MIDFGNLFKSTDAERRADGVPIDQRRFLFLIQETPFFAIDVMRVMAARLRSMNARTVR